MLSLGVINVIYLSIKMNLSGTMATLISASSLVLALAIFLIWNKNRRSKKKQIPFFDSRN